MPNQTLKRYEKALEHLRLAHEEISVIKADMLAQRKFGDAGDAGNIARQIKEVITQDNGEAGLAMLVDYWKGAPR